MMDIHISGQLQYVFLSLFAQLGPSFTTVYSGVYLRFGLLTKLLKEVWFFSHMGERLFFTGGHQNHFRPERSEFSIEPYQVSQLGGSSGIPCFGGAGLEVCRLRSLDLGGRCEENGGRESLLQNVQFWPRARKAKILTGGILEVF